MLGSNFALLVKSPGDDGQQLLTTGSSYVYRWSQLVLLTKANIAQNYSLFRGSGLGEGEMTNRLLRRYNKFHTSLSVQQIVNFRIDLFSLELLTKIRAVRSLKGRLERMGMVFLFRDCNHYRLDEAKYLMLSKMLPNLLVCQFNSREEV